MVRQTFSGPEEEKVFEAAEEVGGKDREMPPDNKKELLRATKCY